MRILLRTSNWAIWARRLGSFSLPLVVTPIVLHRAQAITSPTFAIVEAFALGVALVALVVSLMAFKVLWWSGDHGWKQAIPGFIMALICFVPVGIGLADGLRYPLASEVSTDISDPPPLVAGAPLRARSGETAAKIAAAFPGAKSRHYPLAVDALFPIVREMVLERGWTLRVEHAPGPGHPAGQLNALAMTLLGWRDEVSIRLRGDDTGTEIAMRSAALSRLHEPGVNGHRIVGFLGALDGRVATMLHDEPVGAGTDNPDADTAN